MATEKAIAIRVQIQKAETIRKELYKKKMLRNDLIIAKDNKYIYFPINNLSKKLNSNIVLEKDFEKKKPQPKSYKEIVSIPNKLKKELPTSYDIIGNIILIKLPENLLKFKEEIGESLLKTNKNIRTICLSEPVTGEFRTRNIRIITGEKLTITTHNEFGLVLEIDVKKTYFSPRLANERKRIADLVKQGEIIVDMFTGVAPFSIMIARYANPKIIYAIDKNKDAIQYAKQNVKKNNVLDKVEVIHEDVRRIQKILNTKADRIIMNLPLSAHKFFGNALQIAKDSCIIHYYNILKEEKIQKRIEELKIVAKENKTLLTNFNVRKIKTYSPREFYIGIDITAKKMPM
jgi:tRNA (guanine37-N1)-methyltransferase